MVLKRTPGLVVGAVGSNYVGKGIDWLFKGKATPIVSAGMTIVAGAILPGLVGSTSKKDEFLTHVADGIMTQGALKLLKSAGVPGIGAYDETPDTMGDVDDYHIPEDAADVSGYGEGSGGDMM